MNFQKFSDEILDLSNAATMEQQIEIGIKNISELWENMKVETNLIREKIYRIRTSDEIFQILDDNLVQISAMKSTKFVEPFAKIVDYWEKTLCYTMECLENALLVQRQWLYLENIFSGEDIKKQLPEETKSFESITSEWSEITGNFYQKKFILKSIYYEPGDYLFKKLIKMIEGLEIIQRKLEIYLESKRQIFPRFYFISNDDLLEILANSKMPEVVQSHMKKLFDNLCKLKLNRIASGKTIKWETQGMYSDDGEYVPFITSLTINGPAEVWLNNIENLMKKSLKQKLKQTRASLKELSKKRDKWLDLWPGQLCLTTSQIKWTTECTRALIHCQIQNERRPLKALRKKQNHILSKLSEQSRRELTKQQRLKVNSLITIEIHGRDVIDRMYKKSEFILFNNEQYYRTIIYFRLS